MHGHNYKVVVEIRTAILSDIGFVLDYRELSEFKDGLDSMLDHRCLNDVMIVNPTAEHLAKWLWERARAMLNPKMEPIHEDYGLIIHVSETPKTWATYDGHED
jgi:6-pyruvoyltetrahydropterin/6-carboxytetrahydropterin synthase